MKTSFLIILFSSLLFSCNFEQAKNPNELTQPLLVENAEIGWKVEVPAGWEMISAEESQEMNEVGYDALEESMGLEIDAFQFIELLNIKKKETNILNVTAQPFFEEYIGEWNASNEYLKEILLTTYEDQGFAVDISPNETEKIYGLEFMTYSIKIIKQDKKNEIKQIFYSSLHNGFDISTVITYTDDVIKDEMLAIWRSSKFEMREMPDSLIEHYAKMENDYAADIVHADLAFEQQKYGEAIFWYERANELNPLNEYPLNQLEKCENLADDNCYSQLEIFRSYQKIVDKADELFNAGYFEDAHAYYQRALAMDPFHQYPKEKIIEAEAIIKLDDPDWKPE